MPSTTTLFGDCYRDQRVLVTGHTGFKGAWLALWLRRLGARVFGVALAPTSPRSLYVAANVEALVESALVDIRDFDGLERAYRNAAPDIVFHLAAQPIVGTSYADPRATFDTNVMGTANVLECVRRHPGARAVVIVTSDKCYENAEQLWGYRENDRLGGDDPYSASKGCAELVTASYRTSFFSRGVHPFIATARAGNVIGGGDWAEFRLIPDCARAVREATMIELRNPAFTRPWQFVLDALAGYLQLGGKLASGDGAGWAEAWNFGPTGDATTVDRAAREFVRSWGHGDVRVTLPELFQEKRALRLDSTKARERLGWRTVLDFEATIALTAAWYQRQYELGDGDMRAFSDAQLAAFEAVLDGSAAPDPALRAPG